MNSETWHPSINIFLGFILGVTFCLTFLFEFVSKDIGDGWGAVIGAAGGASITVFGAYAIGQIERKRSRKEKWAMAREEVAILYSRCGDAIDCYDQFSTAEERVSSVYVDLSLGVIDDINPMEVHHKARNLRKIINILRQKADHLVVDIEDVVASLPDDFPAVYRLNLRDCVRNLPVDWLYDADMLLKDFNKHEFGPIFDNERLEYFKERVGSLSLLEHEHMRKKLCEMLQKLVEISGAIKERHF